MPRGGKSHPVRVRGLKQQFAQNAGLSVTRRTPCGCVG